MPAPSAQRVRQHRGIEGRRRGLPIISQAILTLSILALGAVVFLTAGGAIGPLVASLGNTIQGAVGKLAGSEQPSPSIVVATDAPIIAAPDHPLTNQKTINLAITVPVATIGTDAKVRVYVALQGLTPAPVREAAIGGTATVDVGVQLTKGPNTFTATIVRDGVESPPSDPQTITLDQDPPKITVSAPKNGATVSGATVTLTGTTQAQSQLVAQNAANGSSISGLADANGKFSLTLPIDAGANAITITATDPAGNVGTASITVNEGTGKLRASLSASLYRISISKPPGSLQLRVTVADPNGAPVVGASAFFTLQIPGLAPISATITTDTSGRASFTTALVGPMTVGTGLATVLVTSTDFGTVTDRVNLTFVK
ncbi:MAG TPA: Ig-like domain-containing protein [Candidatus Limnocylindrales bacterium]|nr:Ig-like domain-containing protein [Candidatus Limnocylindrales bacterium]